MKPDMLIEIIGDGLIIYFSLTVLLIFVPVLILGRYYIEEPSSIILIAEIILAALIMVIGFNRLAKDTWRKSE